VPVPDPGAVRLVVVARFTTRKLLQGKPVGTHPAAIGKPHAQLQAPTGVSTAMLADEDEFRNILALRFDISGDNIDQFARDHKSLCGNCSGPSG